MHQPVFQNRVFPSANRSFSIVSDSLPSSSSKHRQQQTQPRDNFKMRRIAQSFATQKNDFIISKTIRPTVSVICHFKTRRFLSMCRILRCTARPRLEFSTWANLHSSHRLATVQKPYFGGISLPVSDQDSRRKPLKQKGLQPKIMKNITVQRLLARASL